MQEKDGGVEVKNGGASKEDLERSDAIDVRGSLGRKQCQPCTRHTVQAPIEMTTRQILILLFLFIIYFIGKNGKGEIRE